MLKGNWQSSSILTKTKQKECKMWRLIRNLRIETIISQNMRIHVITVLESIAIGFFDFTKLYNFLYILAAGNEFCKFPTEDAFLCWGWFWGELDNWIITCISSWLGRFDSSNYYHLELCRAIPQAPLASTCWALGMRLMWTEMHVKCKILTKDLGR